MPKQSSINFEFANKFNYAGLNNDQIKPEYARFKIDYEKLLSFLKQHGIVFYSHIDFKSKVSHRTYSMYGPSPATSLDVIPRVFINSEESRLLIGAKLNTKSGNINLSSKFSFGFELDPSESIEKYRIKIPYAEIDNPSKESDYAITIFSDDFHHIIYIIDVLHHVFSKELEDWLFERVNEKFDKYKNKKDRLDFLYEQIPIWIIARRDNNVVFNDLKTILKGRVNEWGTNEEFAVLRIIKSFATPLYFVGGDNELEVDINANSNFLLNKSLTEKVSGKLVFHRLYEVMHDYGGDDNFSAFIQLFYLFWLESEYVEKDFSGNGQSLILDYQSNKVLGFYSDDKNFTFKGEFVSVSKTVSDYMDTGTAFIDSSYEVELANPHLYQPINIPEIQQDGEMKFLSNVVPAFYLKAFDDKNAYANLEKAIWLVIDIVTTFSGVGNLLKLRHLTKVAKAWKTIRVLIAGIEVTSGVIGIMLNFVDECDNPSDDSFCNKLRTFLIYVDLATLGVDAITSKFIRRSAQNALNNMPNELRRQYPEIAEELKNVARRGHLTDATKESIKDFLRQYNLTPKFHIVNIDLYDQGGKFIFRLGKSELEAYFDFISLSKRKIRSIIKKGNRELLNNPNKYDKASDLAKRYNTPASRNKLAMDFKRKKEYLYSEDAIFKIRLTGSRNKDFEECRKILSQKTGLSIDEIEDLEDELYVWHHLDDINESFECTMQFALKEAHSPSHIGSVGQFTESTGITYK